MPSEMPMLSKKFARLMPRNRRQLAKSWFFLEEPGFRQMPIICARTTKINAKFHAELNAYAELNAKLPSFIPVKCRLPSTISE